MTESGTDPREDGQQGNKALNASEEGVAKEPAGTKKPSGPPTGTKKPSGPPSSTRKPVGPPKKAAKPAAPPSATKKPAMPPATAAATRKPTLPPGSRAKPPGRKPTLPPGSQADQGNGLTRKAFESDQDVRWCPGCGDYAILATVQRLMPELNVPREDIVFISGIGCSSRFPYYMNTYGFHSIHGRAPAIATGLKASRPDLDVWIVTGDGDALSIGGNHLIHLLRRNLNVQLLLFNNQIYGLTKGQYSPTSEVGKVTNSTPYGSIDHPFNPSSLAIGADASFVARTMDRDPKHMKEILRRAHAHQGASFIEIYQNCNIFNDGAFFSFTEKDSKPENALFVKNGKPLTYAGGSKGLRLNGFKLESIDLTNGRWSTDDCVVFDESSRELASIVTQMFFTPGMPQPFGVFFVEERPTYEAELHKQVSDVTQAKGEGDLQQLLGAGDTWNIN